jgi:nucleoside-diphosphate kinase
MERSLVLLKPDAVQRGLVGELISRLEAKGMKLAGMKLIALDRKLAGRHYAEHTERPFFSGLVDFITSSPVVALVIEGENSVKVVRGLMGATNPLDAAPGTVRGDLAASIGMNLVHGSDSLESAAREIDLFFEPEEILSYERDVDGWI